MGSVTAPLTFATDKGYISTHTLRGERDQYNIANRKNIRQFQLTRSVGSVTECRGQLTAQGGFQLTRSVGSVTCVKCGEPLPLEFQLTRSVGSVT